MQNTRTFKSGIQFTKEETKNLLKTAHASKVVNPFTHALTPPFIGRRRDFYIPKIPSNLRNIPSVNMYTNVFYILWFVGLISYIYKPAPSSYAKAGLLKLRLWLGLLQIPESFIHNSLISEIWTYNFADPCFQRFTGSWFHISATSWFQAFAISWFQASAKIAHPATDWEFKYKGPVRLLFSCFSDNLGNIRSLLRFFISPFSHESEPFPMIVSRICFMNFDTPTFRGWHGFIEFPNTSPSGKRVNFDDPFPQKPTNSGKKRHPRNVGVDTRPP
jgi:hypothetical protein